MKPDYGFPSSEIEFPPEFSARERKFLLRKKKVPLKLDFIEWFIIAVIFAALVFLGLEVERQIIDPALGINRAEASERPLESYQVREDWTGQTKEYCKTYLETH